MRRMLNKEIPWVDVTGSVYITNNATKVRKNELGQKELQISFTGVNGGSGALLTLPAGYAPVIDIPIEIKTGGGALVSKDIVIKTNGTIMTQMGASLTASGFRAFIIYV